MNPVAFAAFVSSAGGLLTDTLVAWFAILGGAAGFVSLAITLVRSSRNPKAPSVSGMAAPVATPTFVESAAPARPAPKSTSAAPPIDEGIPAEVMALISAAVAMTIGRNARIASVVPVPAHTVELLQQWSIEGRRQIYSSHQIR